MRTVNEVALFHKKRCMFFITPTTEEILTRKGKPWTHETWAKVAGFSEEWPEWARGYFWKPTNQLFFYYGHDFRDYARIVPAIMKNIKPLLYAVGGDEETLICGGMNVGEPGTVWEPIQTFGNLEEFLKNRNPETGFVL